MLICSKCGRFLRYNAMLFQRYDTVRVERKRKKMGYEYTCKTHRGPSIG